jgi:hypothetical protein
MLENPKPGDPTFPLPILVRSCFDGLQVRFNRAMLEMMRLHLEIREDPEKRGEDTDFDRWIHGQIYFPGFNLL